MVSGILRLLILRFLLIRLLIFLPLLLVPLLKLLHESRTLSTNRLYMILILLLMLR